MDDDVKIVLEEGNDMYDNDDEEIDGIDGAYREDGHQGLLEQDVDNLYDNDTSASILCYISRSHVGFLLLTPNGSEHVL